MGNVWTSLCQSDATQDSYLFRLCYLSFGLLLGFSIFSLHTYGHMLFGLFAPHCANKPLNHALKLNLGLLLCVAAVDPGNPVKSVMLIIIITEAPWRMEDAIHHNPPSIFPAVLFPPAGQFQSNGYGSVELYSIASCSFVSVVTSF